LLRLQQQGWIAAQWGMSDNNRKPSFTRSRRGARAARGGNENWERISGVVGRVLRLEEEIAMGNGRISRLRAFAARVRGLDPGTKAGYGF